MSTVITGPDAIGKFHRKMEKFRTKTLLKRMDRRVKILSDQVILPAVQNKIRSILPPPTAGTLMIRRALGSTGTDALNDSGKLIRSYVSLRKGPMTHKVEIPAGTVASKAGRMRKAPAMRKVAAWVQTPRVFMVTEAMHRFFQFIRSRNSKFIPPKVGRILFAPGRPFIEPVGNSTEILDRVGKGAVQAILLALRDVGIK